VAAPVDNPRPPRTPHPRGAPVRTRPRRTTATARSPGATRHGHDVLPAGAPPDSSRGPLRDRGSVLLLVFTSALLVMVGLISLASIVDRAWILIPVMAIDLTVTGAVLATVVKLMDNDTGD
jgi:hypothetical protein